MGGGFFERARKVQTSLTRIFIVLESESHDLSENCDGISRKPRKFNRYFSPKTGGLQKKKFFIEIESDFSAKIGNSNVSSAQKQVVSKKKKIFIKIESDFSAKIGNSNVFQAASRHILHNFSTQFPLRGGAVFNF